MSGKGQFNKTTQKVQPVSKKRGSISNQVTLDANNPIPFENNSTLFSYINESPYIPFLAPKDNYAKDLLEARLLSVTNNACIITKKDYCGGDGFHDVNGKEFTDEINAWFRSMNLKNESAQKLNKKAFENKFTWGNVPIEVVRMSVAGTKKLFVYVHDLLEWRLGKPNDDGIVEYAVQSKLFLRGTYVRDNDLKKAKRLPIYSPLNTEKQNWTKTENGVQRTLIWYKNDVSGFPNYGLPSNVASMIYQLLEYGGARYELDNLDNNMVIGGLLALKGNLSQEEANKIAKKMVSTHTGHGKRGRITVVASEEGIEGSDYHDYNTQKDGSFNEADAKWTQKIILANQWDAVLAGIIAPSTLGKGSGFLTKILEVKQNTVIRPEQKDIVDCVWNDIFKMADDWLNLGLSKYDIAIKSGVDISGLTDVDITPAVQINEVRVAKGLPEDPTMNGQYMKQAAPQQTQKGGDNVQD